MTFAQILTGTVPSEIQLLAAIVLLLLLGLGARRRGTIGRSN
jgi:MYXO-CTERM domain-containing protein